MSALPGFFQPRFLRKLQQLKIHTRRSMLGSRQGSHISLRRGHGLEFADFRPYTPGDDFRHIDWGVYGRTDRLFVRQFREEQDLNIIILLDTSASMIHPPETKKFTLARDIALALGYIAMTDGDTVIFSLLGQENTRKFVGPRAVTAAFRKLAEAKPSGSFDFATEIGFALANQKIPGKCFLISDFFVPHEEQVRAIDHLRARNFDISVVQVLDPEELRITPENYGVVTDSETGEQLELTLDRSSVTEYAGLLADHIEKLERYCHTNGIGYLLIKSTEEIEDVVLLKLPAVGILK